MTRLYIIICFLFFFAFATESKAQKDSTHFVFTIQTDTSNIGLTNDSSFRIHTDRNYVYDFDIDWNNDGIFDTLGVKNDITIQYDSSGKYTIRIRGTFPRFLIRGPNPSDREKLISIDQWGTSQWKDLRGVFYNCTNMEYNAKDVPNLDSVSSLSFAFGRVNKFNESIANWDVSNITNMIGLFEGSNFNQDIGGWDVSSVKDMKVMFQNDTAFNQDIGNWNVSKVTDMSWMFAVATSFNQDIGNWNVSSVEDMEAMFTFARSFNQDLNLWDVSSVKDMYRMFDFAEQFNGNISTWKVDSVESMGRMFQLAEKFNSNISNWNVSSVKRMSSMFLGASSFNQDISNWDISSVEYFSYMLYSASQFNQNLGKWDFGPIVHSLGNIFDSSGLSIQNYDSTIIAWQAKPHPDSSFSGGPFYFGAADLKYCVADSARSELIKDGWIFTGDSLSCLTTEISKIEYAEKEFEIYPNPTNGLLNISLQKSQEPILIYNSNARLIKQYNLNKGLNQIDLSEFPNGLYFIRSGNQSKKIMLIQ